MRSIMIFLALAGAGIITWLVIARPDKKEEGTTQQALAVSKHTPEFNASVSALLTDYEKLSESFVKWDSIGSVAIANALLGDVDNIKMEEIKNDSSDIYLTAIGFIDNMKSILQSMVAEKNIRPQREAFDNLTDNIRHFLNTVKYDREKLYLQECTMAFDDTKAAYWISKSDKTEERRNPYLGIKDPKYGSGMLKCGEVKQTINHTGKE